MNLATITPLCVALLLASEIQPTRAQPTTVFSGSPTVKVSEGGTERKAEKLSPEQAANSESIITQLAGRHYWATRGNKELTAYPSGAFTTYVAIDGSGYVRVIIPGAKGPAAMMSPTEEKFDYAEHLILGLRSVTYYGTRK
jgi:hypothetical protein